MNKDHKKMIDALNDLSDIADVAVVPSDLEPGQGICVDKDRDLHLICGLHDFIDGIVEHLADKIIDTLVKMMSDAYRMGLETNMKDMRKELLESMRELVDTD